MAYHGELIFPCFFEIISFMSYLKHHQFTHYYLSSLNKQKCVNVISKNNKGKMMDMGASELLFHTSIT